MKISVITVCYNSAATLEQTIRSVLAQSHPDVEYIVVDGASKDRTPEILENYRNQIAHIISEPDRGIYDAMNKGLILATGDIIGILNSDDIYHDADVLKQVDAAFDSETDCLCTDVEIFSDKPENVIRYYSATRWKPWMFRIGHQPPHPGFFARKICYTEAGFFDTQFRLAADFEILFRFIYRFKFSTKFIPRVTVSMRSGGASQKSLKNIMHANREDHLAIRKNGYRSFLPLIYLKYGLKVFQFFRR